MDNLSNLPPRSLQSISSFSKSPEMPEMTEELPEKSTKRIKESVTSLKKIAQLEADLEQMKKDKDVEMSRWTAKIAQMEANLKIAKLEADLVGKGEKSRTGKENRRDEKGERRFRSTIVLILTNQCVAGQINALQSKNSDLETQIVPTMTFLHLDGWSYLAKTASWYKVIDQEMTFYEAEAYCADLMGHLVSIHSKEENDFVQKLAKTVGSSAWFRIGLKRNPNKGNAFEWTDRSSVDFTNWMVGEPTSSTHAYLWSGDGIWVVDPPTVEHRFICKRSSQF